MLSGKNVKLRFAQVYDIVVMCLKLKSMGFNILKYCDTHIYYIYYFFGATFFKALTESFDGG